MFVGAGSRDIRASLELAGRDAKVVHYGPHALRHRRWSLWLAPGFETVFVKQWSGHSKASMLTGVYGHVIIDPSSDEWRDFWLDAYPSDSPDGCRAPFRCGLGVV